jgi:hypothetical protein
MAATLSSLIPVFGFNGDGSFKIAPPPAVMQFPGVPQLARNFGNWIGLSGTGTDVNASAGIGLPFAGFAGDIVGRVNNAIPGLAGKIPEGLVNYEQALVSSVTNKLTKDIPGGLFKSSQWGIFRSDATLTPVTTWDSVIKVDYRHEMKISDFPVERGNFASYNKVQVPFDIRISFAIGGEGGTTARATFLAQLETAVQSLDLFVVVTPEAFYPRANLIHMEYSRESRRGLNLLVVEVWVQEVRTTEGASFTDMSTGRTPTFNPTVTTGSQQPTFVGPPQDIKVKISGIGTLPGGSETPGSLSAGTLSTGAGETTPTTEVVTAEAALDMPTRNASGTSISRVPPNMPLALAIPNPADSMLLGQDLAAVADGVF